MKSKGLLVVAAILGIAFFWGCNVQKSLVGSDETINKSWGNVQNQYQRRMDLIENLVNTVKGEANFEKSTLEAVINARASATKVTVDPSNVTPEKLAEFQNAQGSLSQAFSRLMMVTENYPQLKANAAFQNLATEIAGTENRIAKERDDYNQQVQPYNTKVRSIPTSLIASMLGFKVRGYFEADKEAQKAPKVNFENGGAGNATSNSAPGANGSSAPGAKSSTAPTK